MLGEPIVALQTVLVNPAERAVIRRCTNMLVHDVLVALNRPIRHHLVGVVIATTTSLFTNGLPDALSLPVLETGVMREG